MRLFALLLFALVLCGCSKPTHVSPAEFKKQYAAVGESQSMHAVAYLGQRDGKAFIRVSSMSAVSQKWSDEIIYVKLAELEQTFRDALPKTEFKK